MSRALSAPQQQPTAPTAQDLQDQAPDWKQQLTERLDAYRSKHSDPASEPSLTAHTLTDSRASKIARSVASRYAAAPSYSELLRAAAEAEKAAAEARALLLAERIARDERIADEKLAEEQQQAIASERNEVPSPGDQNGSSGQSDAPIRTQPGTPVMPQFAARSREMHMHQTTPEPEPSLEELWASALVEPRSLLPSKLIEFPRELVSSRRARPRLPENPNGEIESTPQEAAQLRIFEVHPEEAAPESALGTAQTGTNIESATSVAPLDGIDSQTATNSSPQQDAPARGLDSAVDGRTTVPISRRSAMGTRTLSDASTARAFKSLEWAAISLDREPAPRSRQAQSSVVESVPFLVDPASIDRRVMAFAVDFAAVTAGFLGFVVVFVASTPHLPTGLAAIAMAGGVYAVLWLLYQILFFSLSGATAGMLYARIALCTFDDRNPTRQALRRRLAAWWLSCIPLGIGFFWCFVDEDNLSWHDRMTGMYQRVY